MTGIGENIRTLRKKAGFTQKILAEKVGVNEVTIRSYEAGKYIPKYENMIKLANALNVSIQEILNYDNMIGNITPLGDIVYIDSDVIEYNRIIEKQENGEGFTPYDRHFISDYIDKSPLVREWFIENGLKSKEKKLKRIQNAYEHLNNEGREEAAKRIEELTEIERYTKPEEWFKGRIAKEEIDKAVKAYLNDDNPDIPPQK